MPDDAPALCAMANLPGFRFGTGRVPYGLLRDGHYVDALAMARWVAAVE